MLLWKKNKATLINQFIFHNTTLFFLCHTITGVPFFLKTVAHSLVENNKTLSTKVNHSQSGDNPLLCKTIKNKKIFYPNFSLSQRLSGYLPSRTICRTRAMVTALSS